MQLTGGRHRVSQRRYPEDKAKCVAYATYTVVSSYTVTTGPFHKSYKSGSSRLQPSEAAAAVHVVQTFTASTRSDVLASEPDLVHSEDRICFGTLSLALLGGRSRARMATKYTTYSWVCKPHYIHTIYPNVHLSKYAMFCQ